MSLSDFELGKRLGKGGHSNVMSARQKNDSKIYAVKTFYERNFYENEVKIYRHLANKSTYIVHYSESFEDEEKGYIFLQYICYAKDLHYMTRNSAPLIQKMAKSILLQICYALQVCHLNKIIHTDIKPENVLVDSNYNIKIFDFDCSILLDNDSIETQRIAGTPCFFCPIKAHNSLLNAGLYKGQSRSYSYETDIWSLGVTLYTIFEDGQDTPFEDKSKFKELDNICSLEPKRLVNIPDDIWKILVLMLDKNKNSRISIIDLISMIKLHD